MQKIKFVLYLNVCLLFCGCNVSLAPVGRISGLTSYNKEAYSANFPENSRSQIFEFRNEDANYLVYGSAVYKNLVENSGVVILNKMQTDTIICGRYFTDANGESYIDGFKKDIKDYNFVIKTTGVFKIANDNEQKSFTVKSRKAHELNIEMVQLYDYQYRGGIYPFDVRLKKNDMGYSIVLNYTIYQGEKNIARLIAKLQEQNLTEVDVPQILSSIKYGALTYNNGNRFEGFIETSYNNGKYEYSGGNGTLYYKSGEKFVGNLLGKWKCGVPMDGTMTFNDGTIINGYWFENVEKYFVSSDFEDISKCKTPTEKMKRFAVLLNNKYSYYKQNGDVCVSRKQYEESFEHFEHATEIMTKCKLANTIRWTSPKVTSSYSNNNQSYSSYSNIEQKDKFEYYIDKGDEYMKLGFPVTAKNKYRKALENANGNQYRIDSAKRKIQLAEEQIGEKVYDIPDEIRRIKDIKNTLDKIKDWFN